VYRETLFVLTESHTFQVSKIINAPLRFVYDWCTDFREDDRKMIGSKRKRIILQKTKRRVVYTYIYRSEGKIRNAVNIVTLQPPRAWHLDSPGQDCDETADYRLSSLGPKKTRLDMRFKERYKIHGAPTREEDSKGLNEVWDKYVAALENDYAHRK
jgi:hypothetical protein